MKSLQNQDNQHGMNFLKRIKHKYDEKKQQLFPSENNKKQQMQKNSLTIVESDTLHMTIVDDEGSDDDGKEIEPLSPEQWVMILHNGNLDGFSFQRIYFSFLKGIPNYLRYKIWLFFSTQNSLKNFKVVAKLVPEQFIKEYGLQEQTKENGGGFRLQIQELSVDLYQKLASLQPIESEKVQINKDIHRTYSNKQEYKYTSLLLRRVLFALSNSGVEYSQGMNYILLNVIIYTLDSIGIKNEQLFLSLNLDIEKNIFLIIREIVLRMDTVFGNNNIFKVIKELQEKIAENVPEVLFLIYKLGMDCFSMFSQHYFSLLSYNDSSPQLNQLMMDLFFVVGEKTIHAIIVQMMEVSKERILTSKSPQELNQFLKKQLFTEYAKVLEKERKQAKRLSDFGLSFYQNRFQKN